MDLEHSGSARQRRAPSRKALFVSLGIAIAATAAVGVAVQASGLAKEEAAAARASARGPLLGRYHLDEPDFKDKLPGRLKEVSGVTPISNDEVACVQDEKGNIYIYDFRKKDVTAKVSFGPDGDYEELTNVDGVLFVLRSDGFLFEVSDWRGSEEPKVTTHRLQLPTSDNEGIGYDPGHARLLIAPKSAVGEGQADADRRPIFAFDLKRRELLGDPVFAYSVQDIETFASQHGVELPTEQRKVGDPRRAALRFLPASVAVHPQTRDIVVLSGVDGVLVSFDRGGRVTGYARLDEKLLPQPEGLTFMPNGDMVVTTEGAGKKARLVRYTFLPAD